MRFYYFLLLLLLVMLVPLANAETGIIVVTDNQGKTYNQSEVFADFFNPIWTSMYIDNSRWNSISIVRLGLANVYNFPAQDYSTQFTITSGGTGGGRVVISHIPKRIEWIFNDNVVISSSTVVLSYDSDIFTHLTPTTSEARGYVDCAPDESRPVYINIMDANECFVGADDGLGGTITADYETVVSLSTIVTYNVSYSGDSYSNYFNLQINRTGAVVSKIDVEDLYGSLYYSESGYTADNFSIIKKYADGLVLGVTSATGKVSKVIVNSTALSGGTVSNIINFDPASSPAYVGVKFGIVWDLTGLFDEAASYFYVVEDSSGGTVSSQNIEGEAGTIPGHWNFYQDGTWTVTLYRTSWLDFFRAFAREVGHSTIVVKPVSAAGGFNISVDKSKYFNGDNIVFTALNPSAADVYLFVRYEQDRYDIICDLACGIPIPANKASIVTGQIHDLAAGNYTVQLISVDSGFGDILAQTTFEMGLPSVGDNRLGLLWSGGDYVTQTGLLNYMGNDNASILTLYVLDGSAGLEAKWSKQIPPNGSGSIPVYFDQETTYVGKLQDSLSVSNYIFANNTVFFNDDLVTPEKCIQSSDYVCWSKAEYNVTEPFTIAYNYKVPSGDFETVLEIYDGDGKLVLDYGLTNNSSSARNIGTYKGVFKTTDAPGKWTVFVSKQATGFLQGDVHRLIASHRTILNSEGAVEADPFNGSNSDGTGGFTGDEIAASSGDFMYNYKSMIYGLVGTSPGTLFFMGVLHVAIFAILFVSITRMPLMAMFGAFLGLGFSIAVAFIPLVWGVVIVVLAGVTFMGLMKKG